MNHTSRSFAAPGGRPYKSHAWELYGDGFRRELLLFGFPLWPLAREKRLLGFLLERGFRVHSLELDFAAVDRPALEPARAAVAAYAAAVAASGKPLYALAASFLAPALSPTLVEVPGLAGLALVGPAFDLPPAGLRRTGCFLSPRLELDLAPDSLSGQSALLHEFRDGGGGTLVFHKRDLRRLAAEAASGALLPRRPEGSAVEIAAFVGEEDPFVPERLRVALAAAGARVYAYPRVRHLPAYDRYADNYYADLGSFLDGIEAKRRREETGGAFQ